MLLASVASCVLGFPGCRNPAVVDSAHARFNYTVHAQFTYMTNSDNTITITGYTGTNAVVAIPRVIQGMPVTCIGCEAFLYCNHPNCDILGTVTIPIGVTNVGSGAFGYCNNLTRVYFEGNAPCVDSMAFGSCGPVTIYHLPDTAGWSNTFADLPTVIWNPRTNNAPNDRSK